MYDKKKLARNRSVNFNSHFRPAAEMQKKTQHGVVGSENRREDLRDHAQSIGDAFYALGSIPVPSQTPNSHTERVV